MKLRRRGRADNSGYAITGGGTTVGLRWFSGTVLVLSSAAGFSVGIGMI